MHPDKKQNDTIPRFPFKISSESLCGSDFSLYFCPVHLDAQTFSLAQTLLESRLRKSKTSNQLNKILMRIFTEKALKEFARLHPDALLPLYI